MRQAPATIFLVDDDESVLRGLGRLLRAAGHATKPFASPSEFLAQLSGDTPGCGPLMSNNCWEPSPRPCSRTRRPALAAPRQPRYMPVMPSSLPARARYARWWPRG